MKLLYKIINIDDGKDCTTSTELRPNPNGTGVQRLDPPNWVADEDHKVIFGYEHTDGRRFYDGDRVSGYIYDGLGPDYGHLYFTNATVRFDTNECGFVVDDKNQYLGDLWGALVNGAIGLVE
jgi:hypothetical protein